jgi:hypothetical protein
MPRSLMYLSDNIQRKALRQMWLDIRKFSKQFTNVPEYKDILDISAPCVKGLGGIDKKIAIERVLKARTK